MRKKYLSALLFGALLFASAGTFTSCKDYDDDINNLQSQITANADAIKALQDLVGNGDYVTNIEKSAGGLVVTFKKAGAQTITLEDKVGSVVTVNEEGVLCIDGEPTAIKAATSAEEGKSQVIIGEDNCWAVLQEDGTYKSTSIPVSGVSVSGSEAEGYTFTIYENGKEPQTVKLPSAASQITSIELSTNTTKLTIYKAQFDADKAKDWKGKATLPADNSYIVSTSGVDVRVNPVSAPATEVKYFITNTENKSFSNITLSASATDIPEGGLSKDEISSRATYSGNGLFTLAMKQTILSEADGKKLFDTNGEVNYFGGKALAVNANNTARSAYGLTAEDADVDELTAVQIKDYATDADKATLEAATATEITVDKDKVYTVEGVEAGALYDVYFTVSEKDATNYGIVVDDLAKTFKITKRPDVSTAANPLTLTVNTLDVYGNISYATYSIKLSDAVSTEVSYEPVTFELTKLTDTNDNNNFFNVEMSVLKEALGETKWQEWFNAVSLANTDIAFYTDADCTQGKVTLDASKLSTSNLKSDNKTTATEAADLAIIKFNVVKDAALKANKQYYAKVTFNNSNSTEVNHIVVPVKFTAPVLSDLFEIASGYWNAELETVTAYFRTTDLAAGATTASTKVTLKDYFTKSVDDATVNSLSTTNKVADTDKTEDQLFKLGGSNFGKETVDFNASAINNGKPANGYGQILTLNVSKNNYAGWAYADEAEGKYKFNIRLMSPIYEGEVKVVNNEITIDGNDLVKGANITDDMIKGIDYNKLEYSLMPGTTEGSWATPQVANVSFNLANAKYIENITAEVAKPATETEAAKAGYFKVTGQPVEATASETLPIQIKDKWGYILTENVKFNVVRNK